MDMIVIDGIDYLVDFKGARFVNLLLPESQIAFTSPRGTELCQQLGITYCETCHHYVTQQEWGCPFCEHLLLCE